MTNRPKRLSRKTIHKSQWVNLHVDRVEMPGGRIVEEMHVVDQPLGGVGILVLNSKGEILLEYAYRYHTGVDGWEIPAGGMDEGESAIETGKREVLEETGYETKDHKIVYIYNPLNGISNKVFHIIRCAITDDTQKEFDTNEVREVRWFTTEEIKEMIKNKEIADGQTITAFLLHISGY